jgi:nicotinamidase-related amidase
MRRRTLAGPGTTDGIRARSLFEKDVYGAFTDTGLEDWLREHRVQSVIIGILRAHVSLDLRA